jgi:hypothetical protein
MTFVMDHFAFMVDHFTAAAARFDMGMLDVMDVTFMLNHFTATARCWCWCWFAARCWCWGWGRFAARCWGRGRFAAGVSRRGAATMLLGEQLGKQTAATVMLGQNRGTAAAVLGSQLAQQTAAAIARVTGTCTVSLQLGEQAAAAMTRFSRLLGSESRAHQQGASDGVAQKLTHCSNSPECRTNQVSILPQLNLPLIMGAKTLRDPRHAVAASCNRNNAVKLGKDCGTTKILR